MYTVAITDPEGGKWTVNATLMVLREKCSNITGNSPLTLHAVELSVTLVLYTLAAAVPPEVTSGSRVHNSVLQFHQSQRNTVGLRKQSIRPSITEWQITVALFCLFYCLDLLVAADPRLSETKLT